MTPLDEEVWKPVPSRPGLFASSHGRIMREPQVKPMPRGGVRTYVSKPTFGVIQRASSDARHLFFGYAYRGFGNVKVHSLVCEAFHGTKPEWADGVRHKNENGLDNRPSNLEWSTQRANLNDAKCKVYHSARKGVHLSAMSKERKRRGIYDSVIDVGVALWWRKRGVELSHV